MQCIFYYFFSLIWMLFAVFTFLHIFANYKAVISVAMETINQTRLYFITQHYLQKEQVLDVKSINAMEPVIFRKFYNSKLDLHILDDP